jgi:hypothetical protein
MLAITTRRIMGEDVTDRALIDVRDLDLDEDLDELFSDDGESALAKALHRILVSGSDRAASFQSSI